MNREQFHNIKIDYKFFEKIEDDLQSVLSLYSASDLLLAPSRLESFGIVAQEAASGNLPSVVFSEAGFEISNFPIKIIKILNDVTYEEENKYIKFEKSNVSLDIDFEIKYSNSFIGNQKNKINVYENDLSDIYNSRTFCLHEDV